MSNWILIDLCKFRYFIWSSQIIFEKSERKSKGNQIDLFSEIFEKILHDFTTFCFEDTRSDFSFGVDR